MSGRRPSGCAPAVFLVDRDRGSYVRAAALYEAAFDAAGIGVETVDYGCARRQRLEDRWVLHHTIGPLFAPVPGARNTAVVFHEWDRYPAAWAERLNRFDSIWAPTVHVADALRASGVVTPMALVPPPLTCEPSEQKRAWATSGPFRVLSVGEPHFRKGFHLLIEGFLLAFPREGDAELTLKVSPGCEWVAPRADIRIVAERLERDRLMELYRRHDVYATASLGEGLGLPVAEAIAAQLPVVANRWGGHRDLLTPGAFWEIAHDEVPQVFCSRPGYYAPGQRCAYSSPERIATALRAAYEASAAERARRAALAYEALDASYSIERIAAMIRTLEAVA